MPEGWQVGDCLGKEKKMSEEAGKKKLTT